MGERRAGPGPAVQLEFRLDDATYPIVGASADGNEVVLEEVLPRGDGIYADFFSVRGDDPSSILTHAREWNGSSEAKTLYSDDDRGLFEVVVDGTCPVIFLSERGTIPRHVRGTDGEAAFVVDVPPERDPGQVIDAFVGKYPGGDLVARRQRSEGAMGVDTPGLSSALSSALTDRQREILHEAYESGYYASPAEVSGEDLAERLNISSATLYEHLRTAERSLVSLFLEATAGQGNDPPERQT